MKCPNCAAPSGAGAVECPSCGLVFAKWRERMLKALEPAPPPARSPWIGRAIAAVVVTWWLAGLTIYYLRRPPLSRSYGGIGSGPSGSPPGAP